MNYTKYNTNYTEYEINYTKYNTNYTKHGMNYTKHDVSYTKHGINYTKYDAGCTFFGTTRIHIDRSQAITNCLCSSEFQFFYSRVFVTGCAESRLDVFFDVERYIY